MLHLEGGRDVVLLLHGLVGSPLEVQYVGRELHRAGYSVHMPHIAGLGFATDGESLPATRWEDWLEQTGAIFDRLRGRYERVVVGGLCIGATLALQLAAERGDEVAALALYATTLWYDGWNVPWYRFLLPLAYYTPLRKSYAWKETEPFGLKDTRLRAWVAAQMRRDSTSIAGAARVTAPSLHEAQRLMWAVRRNLSRVTAPALVVHALEDDQASLRSAEAVTRGVRSAVTQMVVLRDCYHIITMDRQKERVARETVRFLDQYLAPLGSAESMNGAAAPAFRSAAAPTRL